MIILRQKEYAFMPGLVNTVKNVAGIGKNAVNNIADSAKVIGANPGHKLNKIVSDSIRHPATASLDIATEAGLQSVGINLPPGMSVPGISKVGNAIEKSVLSKGTRLGLARRAENYMKSPAAGIVETGTNKLFRVATNIAGAMGAGF